MPSNTTYDLSACCCGAECFGCTDPLPTDLVATLSNCMTGTVNLTWNGTLWSGTFTCGGFTVTLEFLCDAATGTVRTVQASHPECEESQAVTFNSCSPLSVSGQLPSLGSCTCCGGTLQIEITE